MATAAAAAAPRRETRSSVVTKVHTQLVAPDDMIHTLLAAPTDGSRDTLDVKTAAAFMARPENAAHLSELLLRGMNQGYPKRILPALIDRMLLRLDSAQMAHAVTTLMSDYFIWKLLAQDLKVSVTCVLPHLDDATSALILPAMVEDLGIDTVRAQLRKDDQLTPFQMAIFLKYDTQAVRRKAIYDKLA
jgi:hypothetical protein